MEKKFTVTITEVERTHGETDLHDVSIQWSNGRVSMSRCSLDNISTIINILIQEGLK